ncbi:Twin-arginine translocation protein TatB [hydrothermal vent metagenome]|uniref:Twin-arginine translocation protein TatB n=1 Tax=hydrothermal vent metagenome TaxID=652676 RepID=A0A3B0Y824_9ZZZZ
MFDIGFWELAVIGVVALLVVGPERLPGLARTTGLWVGRARRFVSGVKADIDREIAADELKKALAEQDASESVYDIIEETKQSIQDIQDEGKILPEPEESEPQAAVTNKSNDANG